MQAATGALPEDVQRLFQVIEDYLSEELQNEHLSATAWEQRETILFTIEQLKEKYHWERLPQGVPATFSSTQDVSDDSQAWNFTSEAPLPVSFPENHPKIFGSEWQKRWCVLDQVTFYYYANEKSKHPKGMFPIENYRAGLASYLRKDARKDCCFELMCPGKRTYEFTAPSPEEAKDWVDHILFLLKDMRSLVIPYEEDVKEETYDDIDNFDSSNRTLLKDSFQNMEEEEETEEDCKEGIYEILPDEELGLTPLDNIEDADELEKAEGFIRSYTSYYQALWDCTGGRPDELTFQRGDLINILSKEYNMHGWWVGELNHVVGIVPKEYLMPAYEVEGI